MKSLLAAVAALLLISAQRVVAEKPENQLAALESKLSGSWKGDGPCTGGITFHADGTYKRTYQGPSGINSAGTWELRWDALPPTLVLICKTSDDPMYVRRQAVKLIELDENTLAFQYPTSSSPTRYSREKK